MNLLISRCFPNVFCVWHFSHAAKWWTFGIPSTSGYKKPSRIFRLQKCWIPRSWPPNLKTTYCWMSSRFLCNIFFISVRYIAGIFANKKRMIYQNYGKNILRPYQLVVKRSPSLGFLWGSWWNWLCYEWFLFTIKPIGSVDKWYIYLHLRFIVYGKCR